MKIAVTYDNGTIFQHFGRTENFKVYEIEDGKVVSSEVIGSNGIGHGALAGLLRDQDIQVLICGGLGGGAMNALQSAGIDVVAGASGSADEAVDAWLKGELTSSGANCDHHHHHEEGEGCCGHHDHEEGEGCCGHHDHEEGEGCGHHDHEEGGCCGHGGGCCGHRDPGFSGPNVGKTCRVHYRGTFDDGTQFDSSYDRGEPIEFVCGAGMMIRGFDAAVAVLEPGQKTSVHLMPEEAYGPADPEAVFTVEISQMPGSENLSVGQQVYLTNGFGQPFPVRVTAKEGSTITFDANHEMAGKELNFEIELVEVQE